MSDALEVAFAAGVVLEAQARLLPKELARSGAEHLAQTRTKDLLRHFVDAAIEASIMRLVERHWTRADAERLVLHWFQRRADAPPADLSRQAAR